MTGSKLRAEGGQALTEFALVLPLLVGVLVVIVQAGVAFNHYLRVADAVRAGARAASVTPNSSAAVAQSAAVSASGGLLTAGDVQASSTDWKSGSDVQVTASVPYSIDVLGLRLVSGTLTSTTTQRIE